MLEVAAAYVKAMPDLTISDVDRLKNSTRRMSANIQELESEKNASIADLQKKVAELETHNRGVTGALERAKSEKGVSGESAESMMEMMHHMKKDYDATIKIRAEHKEDMVRMQKAVDKLVSVIRIDSKMIGDLEDEVEEASGGK